ncbi:MAG: SDR family NAD(P)-dependent oxidoreductase [Rhizobiaceae bacterium]|nr:SDR family NAD(P)-dependent oxidoreductase [Rhizobiaceae bacterium]
MTDRASRKSNGQPGRVRTVLITGATDGIGLLLARAYAGRGHNVLATGRRVLADDQDLFDAPNIVYICADQSDPVHACSAIISAMQNMGWQHLDLAILNGATAWVGLPEQEPANGMKQLLDVNFRFQIHLAHALAPFLFEAAGRLVMIGSTATKKAQGRFATYTATKAGLDGLCRSLREEWLGRADVQIIHPGPTRTNMHAKAGLNIGLAKWFFMSPLRVASAIQYAIRRRDKRRVITRYFAFKARFSSAREGIL